MQLDFESPWGIIARYESADAGGPEEYAEAELAAILGRMTGSVPLRSEASRGSRFFVLDSGAGHREAGGRRRSPRWSWRASEDRVELWGEDGGALLASVYAFLRALGARWVAPGGGGEILPRGTRLGLSLPEGSSLQDAPALCLALGHGALLEDWRDQLAWGARAGYSSILIATTRESLALEAAPYDLYASIKPELAAFARKAGLDIELAGELPWPLLSADDPDGAQVPAEELAAGIASRLVQAHPEVSVFHAWPESLPGGGWRGALARSETPSAGPRLEAARLLAEALSRVKPDAAISFLARPEDVDAASAIAASRASARGALPPGLELLWAPRRRSWGAALGDTSCRLNAAALDSFTKTATAWKESGGGRFAVLERWEDGLLFGGAVPPLPRVIEGDIAAYRAAGAQALGLLRGGCRLPASPRPNAYLVPSLAGAWGAAPCAGSAANAGWAAAAYGAASESMIGYWKELEGAWAIALDIEEGDAEVRDSGEGVDAARNPPADWGDPWVSGVDRLAARRDRCEELFDHLRRAEKCLEAARAAVTVTGAATRNSEAAPAAAAVAAEAREYAVSGTRLELECARLSAYHELAAGDQRAAADIANLALSVSSALKAALKRALYRPSDRRSLSEARYLVDALVDLRLRSIRRMNARSGIRRTLELWIRTAAISRSAKRARVTGRMRHAIEK